MRISDWSSDVCSSDLAPAAPRTGVIFTTIVPFFVDPGLETLLVDNGVEIIAEPVDTGSSLLSTLLFGFGPAILFIAFYVLRSEWRRVGKECVRTCSSRW